MSRHTFFAAIVAVMLAGCATTEQSPFTVHLLAQDGAPVQITNIERAGDNLLGRVTVKNATDKPVMDFDITWAIVIPKNCGTRRDQAIRIFQASQSAYAEQRGTGTLAPGTSWGSRPLKPHEQTEQITPLPLLTLESLTKMAKEEGARRLLVQVWVAYMDYAPPEMASGGFTHMGPDWREERFVGYIPDAADAEQEACR